MKKKKSLFLIICMLFISALWFHQYIKINQYYDSITVAKTEILPMGQKVSFGENLINKDAPANGYTMQVNTVSFEKQAEFLPEPDSSEPDSRIILVNASFECNSADAPPINLTLFRLFSQNMIFGIDTRMLYELNLDLLDGTNPILSLQNGDKCQVILPYRIYKSDLSKSDWKNLGVYPLYLRMSIFPRRIYFELLF